MSLLELSGVTVRFGGLEANKELDITINEGEIVGLIGPNGAGKTTVFNCITGLVRPVAGTIRFMGITITGMSPCSVCRLGIARTFQIVEPYRGLTVQENVAVGAFLHTRSRRQAFSEAEEALSLVGLSEKKNQDVSSLTIAQLKKLEIARALATKPRLLLLDEVMAGLTPTESKEAVAMVRRLHSSGITLFVIEHVMDVIMPISHRVVVLDAGEKIAEGKPCDVINDNRVIKAYLGRSVMLTVEKLRVSYDGVPAVHEVSFHVPEGKIVVIVGSNGAGKSTTMRAIVGLLKPDSGSISFLGERIDGLPPHEIVGRGISLVPEGRRIFDKLTVMENLLIGAYTVQSSGVVEESLNMVYSIFPILEERKTQAAGTLSGGEQSMLTIARALMACPKLIMLDEPSLGLMPAYVDRVFELISDINKRGTTILLVEQNVRASLELADYVYVLQNGRTVLEGDGCVLLESELVKRSYLGM